MCHSTEFRYIPDNLSIGHPLKGQCHATKKKLSHGDLRERVCCVGGGGGGLEKMEYKQPNLIIHSHANL